MSDQVDYFHIEKKESLWLVNTTLFAESCQTCPKIAKAQICYTSAIAYKGVEGTTWNVE